METFETEELKKFIGINILLYKNNKISHNEVVQKILNKMFAYGESEIEKESQCNL